MEYPFGEWCSPASEKKNCTTKKYLTMEIRQKPGFCSWRRIAHAPPTPALSWVLRGALLPEALTNSVPPGPNLIFYHLPPRLSLLLITTTLQPSTPTRSHGLFIDLFVLRYLGTSNLFSFSNLILQRSSAALAPRQLRIFFSRLTPPSTSLHF